MFTARCSKLGSIPYIDQKMDIRTFFVTEDREKSTDYVEAAVAQESIDSVEAAVAQESIDSVEGAVAQESIDSVEGAAAQESTDSVINFVHDPPPNPVLLCTPMYIGAASLC